MQPVSPIKAIYNLAQRNKIFIEYRLEKESATADAKLYTVRLYVGDKSYVGTGHSIKLAKLAAAQLALNDHRYLMFKTNYDLDTLQTNVLQSPTVALHRWATRNNISTNYVLLNDQFKIKSSNQSQTLHYRLYLGIRLYFDGYGYTHQQARNNCALNAFYFLRQNRLSTQDLKVASSVMSKKQQQTKSDVSIMYERAKQLGLTVDVTFDDPLTVTYRIGEKYSATATGSDHKSAKLMAAKKMLKILPINNNQTKVNAVTRIYQLAQLRQVSVQFIQLVDKENFTYQVKFGDNDIAEGHAKTKQLARQDAAQCLLNKLEKVLALPPPPAKGVLKRHENTENANKQEKKHVHFVEDVVEKDEKTSPHESLSTVVNSYKKQLIEACEKLNIHIEYSDKMNEDEHASSARFRSIVSLSTDDRLLGQFSGQGPTLMRAQENASSAVCNNLKPLFNASIKIPKSNMNEKKDQPICIQE